MICNTIATKRTTRACLIVSVIEIPVGQCCCILTTATRDWYLNFGVVSLVCDEINRTHTTTTCLSTNIMKKTLRTRLYFVFRFDRVAAFPNNVAAIQCRTFALDTIVPTTEQVQCTRANWNGFTHINRTHSRTRRHITNSQSVCNNVQFFFGRRCPANSQSIITIWIMRTRTLAENVLGESAGIHAGRDLIDSNRVADTRRRLCPIKKSIVWLVCVRACVRHNVRSGRDLVHRADSETRDAWSPCVIATHNGRNISWQAETRCTSSSVWQNMKMMCVCVCVCILRWD